MGVGSRRSVRRMRDAGTIDIGDPRSKRKMHRTNFIKDAAHGPTGSRFA